MSSAENRRYNLTGQVAIVTGGGRGLGRAFASELARSGASVAVVARTKDEISETARVIESEGGKAPAITADVTDDSGAKRAVNEVTTAFGKVDLLVNNAAVLYISSIEKADLDEWWRSMVVNVRAPLVWTKAVLPGMIERRVGRIINVSSIAAHWSVPHGTAYCASKAALTHLTRGFAEEVREYGIRVFAFAPSAPTRLSDGLIAEGTTMPAIWRDRFRRRRAEGTRLPYSVETFMYLASGEADALTGRHFSWADSPDELRAKHDEIIKSDTYLLTRLPPLPTLEQRKSGAHGHRKREAAV